MQKNVLYFDCFAGISGDMTIGALLDLGIDETTFRNKIALLPLEGYTLKIKKSMKNGISGTDFNVITDKNKAGHTHRHFQDILRIIDSSNLSESIKAASRKIFTLVAEAEAKIHNTTLEKIHFHEVGAIDSIIDIVGTAVCIELLNIDKIFSAPLHQGTGFVDCAHGRIPVPAPAALEITKGLPSYSTGIQKELVTPTGAAIIKTLAEDFIPMPSMTVEQTGYGIGTWDLEIPNMLRIIKGKQEEVKNLCILETNIDDMNPELYSYILPKLLENGALDVYITPIIMKKNRPGNILSVIADINIVQQLEDIIFKETTTFGIRKFRVERSELSREIRETETKYGKVRVKIAYKNGKILKYTPEFEDCKAIADSHDIPVNEIFKEINKMVLPLF